VSTVITLPATVEFGSFEIGQVRYDLENSSELTGYTDVSVFGFPRWRVSLSAKQDIHLAEAGFWEALSVRMRGKLNRLAVWDPVRALPQGSMRGSPALAAAATAGSYTASINAGGGQAGTTLKAGDWLQLGTGYGTSQLVKVVQDLTLNGSGIGTVTFEPAIRFTIPLNSTVIYDKPVAYYGLASSPPGWSRQTNNTLTTGFAFDLLEQWSP